MSEAKPKKKPLLKNVAPTFAEMLTTGDNLRQFRLGAEQSVEMYLRDHHGDLRKAVRKEIEDARTQYMEDNPPPKRNDAGIWIALMLFSCVVLGAFVSVGNKDSDMVSEIGRNSNRLNNLETWQGQIQVEGYAPPAAGTCFDGTKWTKEACNLTIGDASPGDTSGPVTRLGGGPANENVDSRLGRLTAHGTIIGGSHLLQLGFLHKCWFRVTLDDKPNFQGTVDAALEPIYYFENKATIRDGCPGDVSFNLDGNPVNPKNLAKHPKDVEEVTLP